MFERFTDRSRQVLRLADNEARRFGHTKVGPEHLLLGLVKEGAGVGARVLKEFGIDLRKVRLEVEKLLTVQEPVPFTGPRLPHTERAVRALELAKEEAAKLDHKYIGTEHILLGLARQLESVAGHVLHGLGVSAGSIRVAVLDLIADRPVKADEPTVAGFAGLADTPEKGDDRPAAVLAEPRERREAEVFITELQARKDRAVLQGDFEAAAQIREQIAALRERFDIRPEAEIHGGLPLNEDAVKIIAAADEMCRNSIITIPHFDTGDAVRAAKIQAAATLVAAYREYVSTQPDMHCESSLPPFVLAAVRLLEKEFAPES